MEGDVQSFFSASRGLIVPPPMQSKPGYADKEGYGGQKMYNDPSNGNGSYDGLTGQPKPPRGYPLQAQEPEPIGLDDGFAYWVSHSAVIDEKPSTDSEERSSSVLEHLLTNDLPVYETAEQKKNKEEVLVKLSDILDQWMQRVKKKHGIPPDSPTGNAKLLPYGSYKLGVSSPTGDIDSLILAPYFVDREEDFFGLLYPLLTELAANNDNIKELTMVNQQHTIMPLIKMTFYGVAIDMVFARVQYTDGLDEFIRTKLYNEEYLQPMDEKMKRSFNGYRNAEMILKSLAREPEISDLSSDIETWLNMKREDIFRSTLKCIKLWAKVNGLDSNKMGYLGGIAWGLLTAKVCKLFPYKCPARLLERFFWLYGSEWHWDEWVVRIAKEFPDENLGHGRTMYIITPSRPQMNSTHNVTMSTLGIITSRMKDSHAMVRSILDAQESRDSIEPDGERAKAEWNQLFEKYNFFDSYEHFIEVNILGGKDADYLRWQGFVEAKIRMLVERFEDLLKFYDLKIHPWPSTYDRDPNTFTGYPHATTIYIGLSIGEECDDTIDLNIPVIRFVEFMDNEWKRDNPIREPELYNFSIFYRVRADIPKEVLRAEFELPEPVLTEGDEFKLQVSDGTTEFKEIQLSAHKSAMKDDFNQDVEPEETEIKPSNSISSMNGHDMKSPKLGPTVSLNLPSNGEGQMQQESFDLYSQFDQALNAKSQKDDNLLSKRTPNVQGSMQNELEISGSKLKILSTANDSQKVQTFHQNQEFLTPANQNADLWRSLKPQQPKDKDLDTQKVAQPMLEESTK